LDLILKHLLSYLPLNGYTEEENANLKRAKEVMSKSWGYYAMQSTKPQTLGYSLTDSPAGLLAWIYEKLVSAVDEYQWDDDEGVYWIPTHRCNCNFQSNF